MAKIFEIEGHTFIDKKFLIKSDTVDIRLAVDYDEVNHKEVDKLARKLVRILNKHWNSETPIQSRKSPLGNFAGTSKKKGIHIDVDD